ncbi:hypothetical protein FPCIR_1956 [Fusarium pseudocircinatum]|uniref:Uncharacterized protein n=1 Tax=Fusarium pseudocircinatum TaxID=56676 RepID=A0A8H5PTI3_9HYPO|nr:hypothetical protein FPCIR_1956 [Fusarium pseudocircinatum]
MPSQSAGRAENFGLPPAEPTVAGPCEPDVATTVHGEQMNVEAPGRRRFGNCHLWSTSDGPKNASYNIEDDGPQKGLCPRLSIESELMPHGKADQYLEVGLVIGEEPGKYRPRGLSRNKERQSEQAARGVLNNSQNVIQAFIRISEYIQLQAKLFVGYRLRDGHLHAVEMAKDSIFYYQEFKCGHYVSKMKYNDWGEAAFFHDKLDEPLSDETMSSLITEFKIQPDDDDINTKVRTIFTSTQMHANYTTCTPETTSTVRCTLSDVNIPGSEDDEEEEPSANEGVIGLVGGSIRASTNDLIFITRSRR